MAPKRRSRDPRAVLEHGEGSLAVEIHTVPPSPLEVQRALLAAFIASVPRRKATPRSAEIAAERYTVCLTSIDGVWHLIVPRELLVGVL
jgi:hypothetical protein